MTRVLVMKLLRDIRVPLLVTVILLAGFQCLWMKISQRAVTQLSPFFATMASRAGILQKEIEDQLFQGSGKIVQTMAGGENIRFERAMDMLTIGYVHPLMVTIFCIWAIGRAASAVAGELDRGTMELLLAQPIPRSRIILAHLAVDAIVIPIIALSLWFGNALGYQLVGSFEVTAKDVEALNKLPFKIVVDPALLVVNIRAFGPAFWNVTALIFAVSGLTMALSASQRFRSRVIGFAVLLMLVMFLINVTGQLWDVLEPLRPFTVFYYYQPQQMILHDTYTANLAGPWHLTSAMNVNVLAVLFGLGLAGYAAAWRVFELRDLPAPL